MEKVILGMSGGVDSTVSALLLREMGYDTAGVFFVMHDVHLGMCEAARRAAEECGIPLTVVDLRADFAAAVSTPFLDEYLAGRTPNPCVFCNRSIKFPFLLRFANEAGADRIATGHYAAVTERGGVRYIARGADIKKDQSYFLYPLGQEVLSRLLLPLSGMTKEEVRTFAASRGLSAAGKHDSQDICFIPDGDCAGYVGSRAGALPASGDFTDPQGHVLGRHRGVFRYTVGQRRGLGIAADAPLYVTSLLPAQNRVVLDYEAGLYRDTVALGDCVFASGVAPEAPFEAEVCLRYSKKCSRAVLYPADGGFTAVFDTPQRAPAPGQSAVFYRGDLVLGGGIIR